MNGLEVYIDLLEKSDLVTGKTTKEFIRVGNLDKAVLSEERRKTTIKIIEELKMVSI